MSFVQMRRFSGRTNSSRAPARAATSSSPLRSRARPHYLHHLRGYGTCQHFALHAVPCEARLARFDVDQDVEIAGVGCWRGQGLIGQVLLQLGFAAGRSVSLKMGGGQVGARKGRPARRRQTALGLLLAPQFPSRDRHYAVGRGVVNRDRLKLWGADGIWQLLKRVKSIGTGHSRPPLFPFYSQ